MPVKIVSDKLESIILTTAPKHHLSEAAPKTRKELLNWARSHVIGFDSLPINPVKGTSTIFSDYSINYALRAWYDALIVKYNTDYATVGERIIKEAKYLQATDRDLKVLEYELVYKNMLWALRDKPVLNQRKYVLHCIAGLAPLDYEGE